MRLAPLLALVLAVAGCGGSEHGAATLWVTRDRGTHVLFTGSVPAGLDAIQVVERRLKVTTRYGGRYVESIDGVAGSLAAQRDWFYYVDGIEGDRSATEVTVHPGENVWWDYRRWTPATMDIPAVVGAYPEPFLQHGSTRVTGADRRLVRAIAREVHGTAGSTAAARNVIVIGRVPAKTAVISRYGRGYKLELGAMVAARLARDPASLRYRF